MAWDRRNSLDIGNTLAQFGQTLGQNYLERAKKRQQEEEMQRLISGAINPAKNEFVTQGNGQFQSGYQQTPASMNLGGIIALMAKDPSMASGLAQIMKMQQPEPTQWGETGSDAAGRYAYDKSNPSRKVQLTDPISGGMNGGGGELTQLGKHQNELAAIRQANPRDPRIPEYEAVIKKLQMGIPTYTAVQTSEGIVPFATKTGQVGTPTGMSKPLTNEMITAESQLSTLKDSFQRVRELYKPEYVGAVAGRLGGLQEATTGLPQEQAAFYADLADIQNTLIYLKSGKQINESEYQRLLKQIPDKNLPESVFNARMQEFERVMNDVERSRASNMGGYGRSASPVKAQEAGWVTMTKPDGSKVEVHPEDVESAKAQGYK